MNIWIRIISLPDNSKEVDVIQALATVLCYEEPEMMESSVEFWNSWLHNKIEGEKITIIAEEAENNEIVGVVRFWKTPYCNNKWLVEGLEVISTNRRKGIGRNMVKYGLEKLREKGIKEVSANIRKDNIASIKLHEGLGFNKISSGSINSFGDFRDHVDEYRLYI